MKVLLLASCLLAAASAGWAPIQSAYHGPLHHPVIHKGVPVEPVEVQHARAAHLAALEKAGGYGGYYHEEEQHNEDLYDNYNNQHDDYNNHHEGQNYHYSVKHVSHPTVHHEEDYHHAVPAAIHHHIAPAYETSHVHPQIGHDGKPLDTPEVEAAKAHHFAALHKALSQVATQGIEHHYRKRRGIYAQHIPIIEHGVPVEPLEVQHARAEHLAAHAAAGYGYGSAPSHEYAHEGHVDLHENHHGYTLHQKHAPVYGHHHSYYIPKYDHHGLQLDTEEVEHLKALHFAAHAKLANHYY